MNTRFIHFMAVAALLALLPTSSANAFMRYGGGGGMHYGGGGSMHFGGGGGMHSMPQGYPMQSHGMPSGAYAPRVYGGPPRGEIIVRRGPPIERYGIRREREFGGRGVVIERGGYGRGGGVVVEQGGYSGVGGAVVGGAYGYSRWHHHEGGVRETFVEHHRPTVVSRGNCCCDPGVSVVDQPLADPPIVERGLTERNMEYLRSVYEN